MLRYIPVVLLVASSVLVLSCGDSGVVQTGQIIVKYDETADFSQFNTFSVVTGDSAPPGAPEPGPDEVLFNDRVNELIIEAMTSAPVCMAYIPPDEVTDENQPDLWAANGLARTTGEGTYWQCNGGWFWGWWGWQWDPCAWLTPVPIEVDVGNLYVLVGPEPAAEEDPEAVFAGLAQSIAGTGPDLETKAGVAVEEIFAGWPIQRTTCSP